MRWYHVAIILLLLSSVGTGGYVVYQKTRGLRNNNPGNIRKSSDHWQGLAAEQPDPEFFTFVAPEYGIRALVKILARYANVYGLVTVRGIISRWAPPSENDTESYIRSVSSRLGVGSDDRLNVRERMPDLVAAIIHHENGIQPYSMATIDKGISLA